jgi:hypothetical protein
MLSAKATVAGGGEEGGGEGGGDGGGDKETHTLFVQVV